MFDLAFERLVIKKFNDKVVNSRERNIEWSLTLTSVRNLLKAKKCYYTGIALTLEPGRPSSLSIDRIDSTKGYVKGNVVACSVYANSMKSAAENLAKQAEKGGRDVYKDMHMIMTKTMKIKEGK